MSAPVSYYKIFFGNTADIIIDVGTRDGDDAEYLRKSLKAKSVFAIDARHEAIEQTKKKYPDFNVFETAIANYNGTTSFCVIKSKDKDYAGSSSIYNNKFDRPEYPYETIEVPVITMKKFIEDNGLQDSIIDFIKVDIEGYTAQFLYGLGNYINNVKFFHLETEKYPTHDDHRNSADVADYIRKKGFKLVATQYEWGEDIEDQMWINEALCQEF
jgi:FkbM family methyltransferase